VETAKVPTPVGSSPRTGSVFFLSPGYRTRLLHGIIQFVRSRSDRKNLASRRPAIDPGFGSISGNPLSRTICDRQLLVGWRPPAYGCNRLNWPHFLSNGVDLLDQFLVSGSFRLVRSQRAPCHWLTIPSSPQRVQPQTICPLASSTAMILPFNFFFRHLTAISLSAFGWAASANTAPMNSANALAGSVCAPMAPSLARKVGVGDHHG
jgi:hypothetical protein